MPELRGPTSERGQVLDEQLRIKGVTGVPKWSDWMDTTEWVPELTWPGSIETYERMRTG